MKFEGISLMKTPVQKERIKGSFRDPSGFVYKSESCLLRQINHSYRDDYEKLMNSGLYAELVNKALVIPHEEKAVQDDSSTEAYKIIKPQLVEFISYPYEWCFSQLKDAAKATLRIQKIALKHGMSLKDASAFNIQFVKGKPTLIDTLSFEDYKEGMPWVAYRQFCQHFLAPLALMAKRDVRLSHLFRVYIDGVPLDLASKLLPFITRFQPGLMFHIHLHSKFQADYGNNEMGSGTKKPGMIFSKEALSRLILGLEGLVQKMEWAPKGTEWGDYYASTNYSSSGFEHKRDIIEGWLDKMKTSSVWDMGANMGHFSRIASERGISTISFDIDPAAIEKNYRQVKSVGEKHLLPLMLDLTNPSPNLGWANEERQSISERGRPGCVFALALIHHLAISNNLPLLNVAAYFRGITDRLIIEFVPKSDSQVKRLLASRQDVFPQYTKEGFESAFSVYYKIEEQQAIRETERTLYLMQAV